MLPKISACVFIRDTVIGAFCLPESVASLLPFVDEYIIMDAGSTDGTLEMIDGWAKANPKIRIVHGTFMRGYDGKLDPKIFADLANDLVAMCRNDIVLYHQADEICHEDLLASLHSELALYFDKVPADWKGLSFIRYQLHENFQTVKWWPHVVKRVGLKTDFRFVGDGMNAEKYGDAPLVGGVPMCSWQEIYKDYPERVPTNQMILDVSMTGGFLDNILMRRQLHAPLWQESPDVLYGIPGLPGGVNIHEWMDKQRRNPNWTKTESPFNIPAIMKGLVGKLKYEVRPEVIERIKNG